VPWTMLCQLAGRTHWLINILHNRRILFNGGESEEFKLQTRTRCADLCVSVINVGIKSNRLD
jgi:hypothetical protein